MSVMWGGGEGYEAGGGGSGSRSRFTEERFFTIHRKLAKKERHLSHALAQLMKF